MIKVFRMLSGDEIIGFLMERNEETGGLRVEFPFLIETEVNMTTQVTYTDLVPFMYGVNFQGPFEFARHCIVVMPMDPKPSMLNRYKTLIDKIEGHAELTPPAPDSQRKRPGKKFQ